MKKVILLITFWCLLITCSLFAQSSTYNAAKTVAVQAGYTIVEEKQAYILKSQYLFNYRKFYQGTEYVIYAESDDSDVLDVDIYLYYLDGDLRNKDTTADRNAAIYLVPGSDIELKIVVLNYNSLDAMNKSMCRYFIGYR